MFDCFLAHLCCILTLCASCWLGSDAAGADLPSGGDLLAQDMQRYEFEKWPKPAPGLIATLDKTGLQDRAVKAGFTLTDRKSKEEIAYSWRSSACATLEGTVTLQLFNSAADARRGLLVRSQLSEAGWEVEFKDAPAGEIALRGKHQPEQMNWKWTSSSLFFVRQNVFVQIYGAGRKDVENKTTPEQVQQAVLTFAKLIDLFLQQSEKKDQDKLG